MGHMWRNSIEKDGLIVTLLKEGSKRKVLSTNVCHQKEQEKIKNVRMGLFKIYEFTNLGLARLKTLDKIPFESYVNGSKLRKF